MPRYAVWFLIFVCVLLMVICPVMSGFEKYCRSENERIGGHKNGICGKDLSEIITLICDAKYSNLKKRSVDHNVKLDEDDFPRFSPMQGQILGKRNALSYLGRDKRFYEFGDKYQGIVCECCYHHCSYDELSQYCLYDVVDFK